MNYYKALQREADGRWDYTCTRDGKTWATGGCAAHDDGHATEAEAYACQKTFMLTRLLEIVEPSSERRVFPCAAAGCSEVTSGKILVGPMLAWPLCDQHRNKETVSVLLQVGESLSSY